MYNKFFDKQLKQQDGSVFIDRPLKAFESVLNFLRNELTIPLLKNEYDRKMFFLEIKFWGLPLRAPS